VIDRGRRTAEPTVLHDDLTQHHEARRAEHRVQVSERSIEIGHDIADLEQRSGQRTS
jgi:hypothetical protein